MATFNGPQPILDSQDFFSAREVGLTHPDVPGFIRITGDGNIEIVADDGLAIIMSPRSKSITFVADHIKFMTKEGGLRWNSVTFNDRALSFDEPTFIAVDDTREGYSPYRDVDYYADRTQDDPKPTVRVRDDMGNDVSLDEIVQRYKK